MNKRPIVLLGLIALIIATAMGFQTYQKHRSGDSRFKIVQACDLLTPEIARKIGGQQMVAAPQIKEVKTDSTMTTFCVYRAGNKSVSLAVRSPLNQKGLDYNNEAFKNPALGGQTVAGYGDKAFWSPTFAQFNVLKNGRWYIFSNGVNIPSQRSANDAQKLADQVDF